MLRWTRRAGARSGARSRAVVTVGALLLALSMHHDADSQGLGVAVQPALTPRIGETIDAARNAAVARGRFRALSYNVAGIPDWASGSQPSANNPRIGPLLDDFDLVLLQEDFLYHDELSVGVTLPHRTQPDRASPSVLSLGSGLNRFSRLAFDAYERVTWEACHGVLSSMFDCAATKGFSVARTELAPGVTVDVYNLHLDAGSEPADSDARGRQLEQLIDAVESRSRGRAIIVAGDTNLRRRWDDPAHLRRLVEALDLTDACEALSCGQQSVDRVFFRGGDGLELLALTYDTPARFVDADGRPLSDHRPIAVDFEWRLHSPRVAER